MRRTDARLLLVLIATVLALPAPASAERAWLAPERLTPAGIAGQDFDVAVGADGSVVAAWVERGTGKLPLYATVRAPGGAGVARALVHAATTGGVTLAANDLGDTIIAWQSSEAPYDVMVARRRAGEPAFGEPQALPDSRQRTSAVPLIALDAVGNAVVVHAGDLVDDPAGRPFDVRVWHAPAGGEFGAPRVLLGLDELRNGWIGDVALLPTQEAVLLFTDTRYGNDDGHVRAATWDAAAQASDVAIETLAATGDRTPWVSQVEADALGRVTALWSETAGSGAGELFVRHRLSGAGFGPTFPLGTPMTGDVLWHALDLSTAGELLTAWSPGYYDDAGTVVTGGFGAAPQGAQAVPGHPRAVAGGGGPEGDLLVVGHTAPGSYAQRLVTARRAPGAATFTRLRDADAGCGVLSNWTRAATGLDGTGAILSQDPEQGLWLLVDGPTAARPARGCLGAGAYDPLAEDAVKPPVDPPVEQPVDLPEVPEPPAVVKAPVRSAAAVQPVVRDVTVKRSGGAQVVTFSVRCPSCTARARGRLLARRSVLAKAAHTTRARRGAARVKLRFRATRRARSAARGPRRFAIDVRVSAPGAPAAVRRLSVPAR